MTPESALSNTTALPPMIVGAAAFVIMLFGLVGSYIALRKKSDPVKGEDVPQWFYVRDLVHEVRNMRQILDIVASDMREVRSMVERER